MGGEPLTFVHDVFDLMDELKLLSDHDVIRARVLQVISRCGYEHFTVARLPQPRLNLGPYMMLKVWPDEWIRRYDARAYYRDDPAVTKCFSSINPFDWEELSELSRRNERSALVMNEAAEHNLRFGYTVPVHDLDGFQAVVSMSGARVDLEPKAPRALHLLSLVAFETAERLSGHERVEQRSSLSPREKEVLQFSAAGLSQDEVADRLSVSPQTIYSHLKKARHKLGATNTLHAVVMALRDHQIRL